MTLLFVYTRIQYKQEIMYTEGNPRLHNFLVCIAFESFISRFNNLLLSYSCVFSQKESIPTNFQIILVSN